MGLIPLESRKDLNPSLTLNPPRVLLGMLASYYLKIRRRPFQGSTATYREYEGGTFVGFSVSIGGGFLPPRSSPRIWPAN
jgi:hypothetical protein